MKKDDKLSDAYHRLKLSAHLLGVTRNDYIVALADFAEGTITAKQVKDRSFLREHYYTPATLRLLHEYKELVLSGVARTKAIKQLKEKYPRATKAQWEAL